MTQSEPPAAAQLRALTDMLLTNVKELTTNGPRLAAQAREVQASATSPDQMISVTVDASGHLVGLTFDQRIYRRPDPDALARAVLETVQTARARAEDQVTEILEPVMPASAIRPHLRGDFEAGTAALRHELLGDPSLEGRGDHRG